MALSDPFSSLLWYLIAGTRGGHSRAQILSALRKKPMNKHQLSKELKLDYKTIEHHLKILLENNILSSLNKGAYGEAYILSEQMKASILQFDEIWETFGNK